MPRNSSGVYSLPAGNPVLTNTLISSTWANSTLSDVANEVTNSLDRNGRGSMLAPFKNVDGTVALPGMTYGNEPATGFFRKSAAVIGVSVGGVEVGTFAAAGWTGGVTGAVSGGAAGGVLAAGADAVGTPGHTWVGDLDTGVYHPVADQMGFAAGGVDQFRVGTGGVAAYQGNIQVGSNIGTNSALFTFKAGAAADAYIGAPGAVGALVASSSPGDLVYRTNAKEHRFSVNNGVSSSLRLTNSGELLLGDAATAFGAANRGLFEINGGVDTVIGFKLGGVGKGYIQSDGTGSLNLATTTNTPLVLFTNSAERFRIMGGGNVGIATTTPQGKFSVSSSSMDLAALVAWNSSASIFGPNVSSPTGAAIGLGYDTTNDMGVVVSLAPGIAWKKLTLASAGIEFRSLNGTFAGQISSAGVWSDQTGNELGYKAIPLITYTGASALAVADRGRCHYKTDATSVTIPAGVFGAGDIVTILNWSLSNMSYVQGGGMTVYKAGTGTSGGGTILGVGVASVFFQAGTAALISGNVI